MSRGPRAYAGLRLTRGGIRPFAGIVLWSRSLSRRPTARRQTVTPSPRRLHPDLVDVGDLREGSAILVAGRPWSVLHLERVETPQGQQIVATFVPGRS